MINTDKYCRKNKTDKCKENILNMASLIEPFDHYRSDIQALYIRDVIREKDLIDKIFIEQFGFNFIYLSWNVNDLYNQYLEDLPKEERKINELTKKMDNYIKQISKDKLYFIHFSIPGHANIHFINNNKVYIYDPHNPTPEKIENEYWYIGEIKKIYETNGFIYEPLPSNILSQKQLPLCYLYVLHFFLHIFINNALNKEIGKYDTRCDDIYIMKFTRDLLKLCRQYGLTYVETDQYYLLTNNTYKIQEKIRLDPTIRFYDILEKVSSYEMIAIIINNINNLNIAFVHNYSFMNPANEKELMLCTNIVKYLLKFIITNKLNLPNLLFEIILLVDTLPKKISDKIFKDSQDLIDKARTETKKLDISMKNSIAYYQFSNGDHLTFMIIRNYNRYEYDLKNFNVLLNSKTINLINEYGNTLLIEAMYDNKNALIFVKDLLEHGADPLIENKINDNALLEAIDKYNKNHEPVFLDIIKLLIDNVLNKNIKEGIKEHYIKRAIVEEKYLNDKDVLDLLYHTKYGLKYAIKKNDEVRIKNLLETKSIDPNIQFAPDQITPLIMAVYNGNIKIVIMLLNAGADPNIKDKFGLTALDHAIKYDRDPDIIKILKSAMEQEGGNYYQKYMKYKTKYLMLRNHSLIKN